MGVRVEENLAKFGYIWLCPIVYILADLGILEFSEFGKFGTTTTTTTTTSATVTLSRYPAVNETLIDFYVSTGHVP